MAAVTSRRTVPTLTAAHAYLVGQGYTNCGTDWLRGQHDYARLENLASGRVVIVEGRA
ncbi:hypothetical protein D3C85_851000 [compost metagenome]